LFKIVNKGNAEILSGITLMVYCLNLEKFFSHVTRVHKHKAVRARPKVYMLMVLGYFDLLKTLRNVIPENLSS